MSFQMQHIDIYYDIIFAFVCLCELIKMFSIGVNKVYIIIYLNSNSATVWLILVIITFLFVSILSAFVCRDACYCTFSTMQTFLF